MTDITIYVTDESEEKSLVEAPTDMGLSVMEILKASGFNIAATCGGMALCATCHVEVLSNHQLPEPSDDEAYMLDSLPVVTNASRLSCQLKVNSDLDGLALKLVPVE